MKKTIATVFLTALMFPTWTRDGFDIREAEAAPQTAARKRAEAAEFNQWRGPRRDGHVDGVEIPDPLPKKLKKAWQITLGEGHATPVVSGDRIYAHVRQDDSEAAVCIRLGDGSRVWRAGYRAPYEMSSVARAHGKGPKSTPVLHEGSLYTFGISGILTRFDAASGERRWQKKFSDDFASTSPLYGTATSPIVDGDIVVVHVGGHNSGALRAYDRTTGSVRWSWTGDGPGYTSPIAARLAGKRQLITQSQKFTLGVSPEDGRVLWKIPFETPYDQNVVTPVLHGETIIYSGLDQGTRAIRITETDGSYKPDTIWKAGVSMYMNSPVIVGDSLYGMSKEKKGRLFCVDVKSGDVRWQSDGRLGDNVALLHAGSLLWALTDSAKLIAFRPDVKSYTPLAAYEVADSPTWAHPVFVGSSILIKDRYALIRYDF